MTAALQYIADREDAGFITKLVILSQNWERAAALREIVGNWACDAVFELAVQQLQRTRGLRRDRQQRSLQLIEQLLTNKRTKCSKRKQTSKVKAKLRSLLEDPETSSLVDSVSEQMGSQWMALTTDGNGFCLAAALSWALVNTPGCAKHLAAALVELYEDPEYADLLMAGLDACHAQPEQYLQDMSVEDFKQGLHEGTIWADHPELTAYSCAYQVQIVVWVWDATAQKAMVQAVWRKH